MAEITEKANTEILDTSEFEDEPADLEALSSDTQYATFAPPPQHEETLFPLKERFAAWLIDSMLIYLAYWPAALLFQQFVFQNTKGPIPLFSLHGLVFHGLFLLLLLLVTTLLTGLLSATPGKLICGLRVQRTNGEACGLVPALIRTLVYPLDFLCFMLFFGLIFFEKSPLKQRFGDRLAKTYVLGVPRKTDYHNVAPDVLASAAGRASAGFIDLLFVIGFALAYALFLTPNNPELSMLLLVWLPVFLLFGISLLATLSQSSPGKALFGYIVCHEDGSRLSFASSLIRNLFRFTDLFLFGFLSMLISSRKQRLGDTAAGTVVIKAKRSLPALLSFVASILIIALVVFVGNQQRHNFLSANFELNFLPSFEGGSSFIQSDVTMLNAFSVQNVHFAADREELDLRSPPIYKPGETVYLFFEVHGFSRKEDFVWINEDIVVRYPDNSIALKLENAIEYREKMERLEPIQMVNNFALAANTLPGRYSISILLRDRHSRKELQEQRFFYVNP